MGFSERLKELREKNGLSQEALAEKLSIPRSSVTHYENSDHRLPRQKRLNEIADFFGVTVDYLIGRAETSELNPAERAFVDDVKDPNRVWSIEELQASHKLEIDGRLATKEEVEAFINYVRFQRSQE
jgi:transcriptional regulator with XRE-family HTH domain